MISRSISIKIAVGICALSAAVFSTTVSAGTLPMTLDLKWGSSLQGSATVNVEGQQIGETTYAAEGTYNGPGNNWTLEYELIGDPDPTVTAIYTITNNSANLQTYGFTAIVPVLPNLPPPNVMGGSISGSLTDNTGNGATLTNFSPTAVYTALINGAPVQSLLNDPFSASVATAFGSTFIGPASFGTPIPSAPAPNVTVTSIAIQLQFTLTPGDSASFTSVFVVTPEPASLSLLGLGSLALFRRRRPA